MNATLTAPACEALPERACGAIALLHALRSFGIRTPIDQVWRHVAMPDPFGTQCARSYRLAAYACDVGLDAVTLQCRPQRWRDALQSCQNLSLSVIVNHRATSKHDEGHFSRLQSVCSQGIVLEDPFTGPDRYVSNEDMQQLWQANRETVGYTLIAIGRRSPTPLANHPLEYHAQRSAAEPTPACPGCGHEISLSPRGLFADRGWRPDGLWHRFFCSGCDASFTPMR